MIPRGLPRGSSFGAGSKKDVSKVAKDFWLVKAASFSTNIVNKGINYYIKILSELGFFSGQGFNPGLAEL
jgi:hypothetical protein